MIRAPYPARQSRVYWLIVGMLGSWVLAIAFGSSLLAALRMFGELS